MKKVKISKKYWEKGKSKFLEHRPELQDKPDFSVGGKTKANDFESISKNKERRANLKINQPKHSEDYYKDTDVYTNPNNKAYKGELK